MLDSNIIEQLTALRKLLHAHPEVSGKEIETQNKIINFLTKETNAKIQKIANTGVFATFSAIPIGPTVMIRGDIDALPIMETNSFEHQSMISGISHKCGHDGHTCILLGLAMLLSKQPITRGKVILLFQPSEENGMGAKAVLDASVFKNITIDYSYALHNLPGYPLHQIVVRTNEFTANVKSIIIKLQGKTAHAAEPEKGINPSAAIAKLLQYADQITHNNPATKDFFLATPVYAQMGELAYGVSAGHGEVHFTIRCWSARLMEEKSTALTNYIHQTCKAHQLESEITWTQEFAATINHKKAVEKIIDAANHYNYSLSKPTYPFKWGEDFGLFTQQFKGAMFGLGAGLESPALHNADYDFPDEILTTGVNMFYQIIKKLN
jgi:amidohydrolase